MQFLSRFIACGLVSVTLMSSTMAAAAQPVPKLGPACPSGYRDEPKTGYCIPRDAGAKPVLPIKGGNCPYGFHPEPKAGYCISR